EPKILGPHDVIVKIGAAGLCRTDLHIQEGQWGEKSGAVPPYVPGPENAGWVHEIGSDVSNVEVGDTVIVHPFISCGLCRPCRRGEHMHCIHGELPDIARGGGGTPVTSSARSSRAWGATAGSRSSCTRPRVRSSSSTRRFIRPTSPRWPTPATPPSTPSRRASRAAAARTRQCG